AICVLRSKPKDVSVSSHMLHLRTTFPPSGPAPPTADYCWKTYALQLEHELAELRDKHEVQRAGNASSDLNPEITSSVASTISHTNSDVAPPNASKKAKPKKAPGSSDVREAPIMLQQPRRDPKKVMVDIPRNSQLLLALRAFEKAANDNGDESTLLHATLHTLRIVARMLRSAIDHPSAKTAGHSTLSTIGQVLNHTIMSALRSRTVSQKLDITDRLELSFVDKVFDCLIDDIFGPVIRAFNGISMSFMSNLLGGLSVPHGSPTSNKSEKPPHDSHSIDPRSNLMQLFQTLVDSIRFLSKNTGSQDPSPNFRWAVSLSSLKASLILEVTRELERILFLGSPDADLRGKGLDTEPDNAGSDGTCTLSRVLDSMVPGSVSLHKRVKRLIAKDTLCLKSPTGVITSAVFGPSTFTPSPEASVTNNGNGTMLLGLLHETILSALYDLVLKCQRGLCQLQMDNRSLGINFRQTAQGPMYHFDIVRNNVRSLEDKSDLQPMAEKNTAHALKAEVSRTNGVEEGMRNSQAQGQSFAIIAQESELGDPGGRNEITLLCDNDNDAFDIAGGRGGTGVELNDGGSASASELGVYSSDVAGSATECLIDEAGLTMLLGVVERYVLDPEYAS
ncbi:hypothetical protein AN958_12112, partial [Leucoagaricus sp. SymC.cos]